MISIILPVFNKQKYIRNIIEQILSQSYCNFELLIVDDGSYDLSGKICDEYANKDRRVKVFHTTNNGVSAARNLALSKSNGEYIAFLDADDSISVDYLDNMRQCIIDNKVDLVITGFTKIWEESNRKEYIDVPFEGLISCEKFFQNYAIVQLKNGLYGYSWAKLFKKEILKDTYFNETLSLAEDLDFCLTIYGKIKKIYFLNVHDYHYLQEAENNSVKNDEEIDYFSQLLIYVKTIRILENKNAFYESNKQLIGSKISNYIFFVLYYASLGEIVNLAKQLNELHLDDYIGDCCYSNLQKIIILLYKRKKYILIKYVLNIYQLIKKSLKLGG